MESSHVLCERNFSNDIIKVKAKVEYHLRNKI
nr:MAG TPA: hypothetical protein [Caudoviricetes sp.]